VIAADSGEDTQILDHALRVRYLLMVPGSAQRGFWKKPQGLARRCADRAELHRVFAEAAGLDLIVGSSPRN
jgi:hypothetical protein